VGLDGLGGFHMQQEWERLSERMPTLWRLYHEATVATTGGRTIFPPISAPSWVSVLTGMTPDCTGVVHKTWNPEAVPAAVRRPGTTTPWTVFDTIKRSQSSAVHCSLVASWSWLLRLVENSGSDLTQPLCDFTFDAKGDDDAAVEGYLRSCEADADSTEHANSRFTFVHFDMIDMAGHRNTWESEAYRASWTDADRRLAKLIEAALDHSKHMERELVVIVVSDHGGSGKDHGDMVPEHMLVPVVMWSPSEAWKSHWVPTSSGRDNELISLTDICPTILKLLDIRGPCWMRSGHPMVEMSKEHL